MIAVWTAGVLVACAGNMPPKDLNGRSEAEVVQAMGQPTGRYPLPDNGLRLEFAKGPAGRETYMIDLDAQGRVVQSEQVLDANHFDVVSPGMKRNDLLRFIGRPSERAGVRGGGEILSWRYANTNCLWWQAQLDAQGVVAAAGYATMPGCDPM
ncbi:MAG TPA: hypothetical protein VIY30_01405 [Burkholderiaceae bacterium]